MKIAQVCMPFLPVPPKKYGGVERVVSYLTDALVDAGHDVTLFASGDSRSKAKLVTVCDKAVGITLEGRLLFSATLGMIVDMAENFDIIHFHFTEWSMLPYVKALNRKSIITFHMPIDLSNATQRLFQLHGDIPLVSLSEAQRPAVQSLKWLKTIHNGLPANLYSFQSQPVGYFAFLGRIGPSKGPDVAIAIANAANVPLKLAGPIQQPFFDQVVAPQLRPHQIEYVGELNDSEKQHFLGGASALLFPTQVEEAFGLVIIEALACGTPVIALDRGASREILTNGVTGFVVSSVDDAVKHLFEASRLDRRKCRAEFERRFTASRMCLEYCDVYEQIAVDH